MKNGGPGATAPKSRENLKNFILHTLYKTYTLINLSEANWGGWNWSIAPFALPWLRT